MFLRNKKKVRIDEVMMCLDCIDIQPLHLIPKTHVHSDHMKSIRVGIHRGWINNGRYAYALTELGKEKLANYRVKEMLSSKVEKELE